MAGSETKVPPALKSVYPFILVSKQFTKRDPIVSYYCQLYAIQQGISLAKGDDGAKAYLIQLMNQLETAKKSLKEEEALKDEEIGQAHVEEVALKMFDFADNEDRNARFHKNMVKAFFTVGHLFTVLKQFGELSDDIASKMKYAKWKAVEIDRCLKTGVTPTPGPPGGMEDEFGGGEEYDPTDVQQPPPAVGFNIPESNQSIPPPSMGTPSNVPIPAPRKTVPSPSQNTNYPSITPTQPPAQNFPSQPPPMQATPTQPTSVSNVPTSGLAQLSANQMAQVKKYCKFASSALDYNDSEGAIEYLEKSLRLLRTGKE